MDKELISIAEDLADDIMANSSDTQEITDNYNMYMLMCKRLSDRLGEDFTPNYIDNTVIH